MKPSSVPFWWVVRHRDGGYIGEYVDKHVQHQREAGRNWAREDAQFAADWWDDDTHHVVKVHARIPEPKLPAWVTALSFQYQHVQVWRREGGRWTQCVFAVSGNGLRITETITHAPAGIHRPQALWPHVPPDVWAEAAQRAAKMLRARKAGK